MPRWSHERGRSLPPGYPSEWEADVVLRDGTVAHLRPIKSLGRGRASTEFHSRQSEESIYLRFFAPLKRLSERDVHRFTHVDYVDRVALVCSMRDDIIGIGRYDRIDPRSAEVAFNISDHFQGKGIGSVLLEHLAAIARDLGITEFTAEVLPQNRKMLQVFSDAGYDGQPPSRTAWSRSTSTSSRPKRPRPVAMSREHRAESQSVRALLGPKVGGRHGGQPAGVHDRQHVPAPTSRRQASPARSTRSTRTPTRCSGSPRSPGSSDMAPVLSISSSSRCRRDAVLEVVDECADIGVKALLVVSAGFAESGEEGAALQETLVRRARGCRDAGRRVRTRSASINTDPDVRLNASLSPTVPPRGRLGPVRPVRGARHRRPRLGRPTTARVSRPSRPRATARTSPATTSCSTGSTTRTTAAVGLYLESMGNPRKFSRIARTPGPDQAGHRHQVRPRSRRAGAGALGAARRRLGPRSSTPCSARPG
jgi:GNAT superfamily N-acetyltransferase